MSSFSKKEQIIMVLFVVSLMLVLGFKFILSDFINPQEEKIGLMSASSPTEDAIMIKSDEEIILEEEPTLIMIHISGQVYSPGIIELVSGDRVIDAVNLAGGLTKSADLDRINLAKKVEDEEKIYIPKIGELDVIETNNELNLVSSTQKQTKSDKININSSTKAELDTLPGIGEATADKIIEYRSSTPFKSIEELKNVSGIGDKKFDTIKDLIIAK